MKKLNSFFALGGFARGWLAVALSFCGIITVSLGAADKELFNVKCGKCHLIMSEGELIGKGKAGPDLTGYAKKRSADFLRDYTLDPKAAREKYPDVYNKEIAGKYNTRMKKSDLNDAELKIILEMMGVSVK